MTFSAQPVEQDGQLSGFVVSGFVSKNQLETMRELVDSESYSRTTRWRGEYQELAKAIVGAVDDQLGSPKQ